MYAHKGPINLIKHSYSSSFGNVIIKLDLSLFNLLIIKCFAFFESSGILLSYPTDVKRIISL